MKGYAIVIEGDAGTNFSGYSPDLPGVVATGDTLEEVERLMREGIAIYLDELRETGEPVPAPTAARALVAS
ncbi:MAG: type II toxin-antitoxin system HicB family antitoxin [Thermoleophilaceae bacterium]|jgi:predicted RNase H-like HicB family nuclease